MTIDLLIKIGGSCISDKSLLLKALSLNSPDINETLKLNSKVIDHIADDIGAVYKTMKRLVVLTGVGTPGHYTVLKYKLLPSFLLVRTAANNSSLLISKFLIIALSA